MKRKIGLLFVVFLFFTCNLFAAGSLKVSWNANAASENVTKYTVYIRANSDGTGFIKGSNIAGTTAGTVTTLTISNLADSPNYCVRVTASNAVDESDFSSPAYTGVFDFTAPAKVGTTTNPVKLVLNSANKSITVTWPANLASDGVAKYNVYYLANNSDGTGFVKGVGIVGSVAGNVTTYVMNNVADSPNYCVRVTAVDSYTNESDFSDPVYSGVVDFTPPQAPSAPTITIIRP